MFNGAFALDPACVRVYVRGCMFWKANSASTGVYLGDTARESALLSQCPLCDLRGAQVVPNAKRVPTMYGLLKLI